MNNTDEFWSINGVSLHQYGWSVATLGGSRYSLPTRRGSNIKLAYQHGQKHRANKMTESRVINLMMWLKGVDPATGEMTYDTALRWNDSWDFLRRLVWKPSGAQVELTRRWRLTSAGGIQVTSSMAEVADSMEPTMVGRSASTFTMSLLLADPFFYGNQVTEVVPVRDDTIVNNPGHEVAFSSHFVVELVGPLVRPRITNLTSNPDVYVQYTSTIPSGHTLVLDVGNFLALGEGSVSVAGNIVHSGARHWFGLHPGNNVIRLSDDNASSTGYARIIYRPPYI